MILRHKQERVRFVRFAIVGTIGAVVDFSVFNLMISVFGIEPVVANVISFSVAVASNFIWNRYWTYPDSRSKRIRRQLVEFFIVNLIGVLIRTVLFLPLEHFFESFFSGFSLPLSNDFLAHNTALACGMVIVLFWNFFVNRYWTYADVEMAS
jgi:putative flippase GtrA